MVATHLLIVDIDEVACRVGVKPVQGLSLAQPVRDAIERAPRKHTVGTRFRSIPCTLASARSMLDYFNHAASHFQLHGEYGVLPDWTAHRGDVRCGGRPHGQSSTEGGRAAGL
jgi:hypothetical protein